MSKRLFSRYSLGALALPNRVVMAPMNRNRASVRHLVPTPMTARSTAFSYPSRVSYP